MHCTELAPGTCEETPFVIPHPMGPRGSGGRRLERWVASFFRTVPDMVSPPLQILDLPLRLSTESDAREILEGDDHRCFMTTGSAGPDVPPPPGNTASWGRCYPDGAAPPLPHQAEQPGVARDGLQVSLALAQYGGHLEIGFCLVCH